MPIYQDLGPENSVTRPVCIYFIFFLLVNLTQFSLVTKLPKFYIISYKLLRIIFTAIIDFALKEIYLGRYLVIMKNICLRKESNVRSV